MPPKNDPKAFADMTATRDHRRLRKARETAEAAADDVDTTTLSAPPASPREPRAELADDTAADDLLRDETTTAFVEPPVPSRRHTAGAEHDPDAAVEPSGSFRTHEDHAAGRSRPRTVRAPMDTPRIDHGFRLSEPFATGGMATIHLGVHDDDRRIYAIKRLHSEFAHDEYFAQMLLDEAAIAARIRHQNVVPMYGAGIVGSDLILVMEYVSGLTIAELIQAVHPRKLPPRMVTAILADALRGLHAAHETLDEHGRPLDIVHRDVSPPNVHLGADGVTRILDFGIAKAAHRAQTTRIGELKGKLAYMAPEQLNGDPVDRRVDVRAAAVVLWEALAGAPLFHAENETATMARVLDGYTTPPSKVAAGVPPELDAIVLRALAPRPEDRFETALDMAEALDAVFAYDTPPSHEIAAWLTSIAADTLCKQWNLRATLLDDVTNAHPRRSQAPRADAPALAVASAPIPNASTRVAPLGATWKSSETSEIAKARAASQTNDPLLRVQHARLAVLAIAVVIAFFVLLSLVARSH